MYKTVNVAAVAAPTPIAIFAPLDKPLPLTCATVAVGDNHRLLGLGIRQSKRIFTRLTDVAFHFCSVRCFDPNALFLADAAFQNIGFDLTSSRK